MRLLMLSLGIAGTVIGLALCAMWFFMRNHKVLIIAAAYLLASFVILLLYGALIKINQIRKHEYSEE
jgi:hypothetical protein